MTPRAPRWYGIPVRVILMTFIGTLTFFAVCLFLAILGTALISALRGAPIEMRAAYRHIALPAALVAGAIIFVLALIFETRHYRQSRALAAIERMSSPAPVRVAIPMPHSTDRKYGNLAISQYERAIRLAGGEPVRIRLDQEPGTVRKLAATCAAVLLPGSKADIDPARFGQPRSTHTNDADPKRDAVDTLLLNDAYAHRKPVLGICYGLQSLNVYRKGTLVQHIPGSLAETTRAKVNHEAGKNIAVAHKVEIVSDTLLADILRGDGRIRPSREAKPSADERSPVCESQDARPSALSLPVNSSHHQSADAIGEGLRIVARCPDDGIVEALEGNSPDHFILAVQWHPERSVDEDAASRAIFRALIQAVNGSQSGVDPCGADTLVRQPSTGRSARATQETQLQDD